MKYQDFELKLRSLGGKEYEVDVRSPSGEKTATVRFPFDELALESRLQSLEIALLKSSGTRRDIRFKEEESVEEFGKALFDMMLGGEIRDIYRRSRQAAAGEGRGLRLRLRVEAPELASLPWEYMYDEAEGDFVCLSAETPMIRYMALDRPPAPLTIEPPIRVLGMIASPKDRTALDVEREVQRIDRATERLRREGLLEWEWLPGGGWRDLQRAMRGGPWHIFHFVGHGGFDPGTQEGLLAMVDEDGGSFRISATQLGRLLADHHTLRLAVLNSCEGAKGSDTNIFSSTASILMRRGVPAVVAMQYEITDRAAIEFSQVFYEDVAQGLAVDTAVTEARKAISMSLGSSLEWGTPVLYMRAQDGVLFDIQGTPKPAVEVAATSPSRSEEGSRPLAAAPLGLVGSLPGGGGSSGSAGSERSGGPPPSSSPPPAPPPAGKDRLRRNPILLGVGGGLVSFIGLIWLVMVLGGEPEGELLPESSWESPEVITESVAGSDELGLESAEEVQAGITHDVTLSVGFQPDPYQLDLVAGGEAVPDQPGCGYGFVPVYPSVTMDYIGDGSQTLYFYAVAAANTTLHVRLPDEQWMCDNNSYGDGDPLVEIPEALTGAYYIWVGTMGEEMVDARFVITEIDPR